MGSVRHFLVATDTFGAHQIWPGALLASGPPVIMNIQHDLVFGRLLYYLFEPCCPPVRTYLYKTYLNTLYAPFMIDGKETVALH